MLLQESNARIHSLTVPFAIAATAASPPCSSRRLLLRHRQALPRAPHTSSAKRHPPQPPRHLTAIIVIPVPMMMMQSNAIAQPQILCCIRTRALLLLPRAFCTCGPSPPRARPSQRRQRSQLGSCHPGCSCPAHCSCPGLPPFISGCNECRLISAVAAAIFELPAAPKGTVWTLPY